MNENNNGGDYQWNKLGEDLKNDDVENAHPIASKLTDPSLRQILMLKDSEDIEDYLETYAATESIAEAMRKDELQIAQMWAGTDYEIVKLEGWKAAQRMLDLLRDPPEFIKDYSNNNIQMIIGTDNEGLKTGLGKSWTMYTMIEMVQHVRGIPDEDVYTNIKDDGYNDMPSDADDYFQLVTDSSFEKIVGMDEAPQNLQFKDATLGKRISLAQKMARHSKTHNFYISHTGVDIPSDTRRQCIINHKHDETTGKVGFGLVENEAGLYEINEGLFEYEKMPAPEKKPPDEIELIYLSEDSTSETEDWEDKRCWAKTNAGEDCPNKAVEPSDDPVVCINHQNKIEESKERKEDYLKEQERQERREKIQEYNTDAKIKMGFNWLMF